MTQNRQKMTSDCAFMHTWYKENNWLHHFPIIHNSNALEYRLDELEWNSPWNLFIAVVSKTTLAGSTEKSGLTLVGCLIVRYGVLDGFKGARRRDIPERGELSKAKSSLICTLTH